MISIKVQTAPFNVGIETQLAHQNNLSAGALVCFSGFVRDFNDGRDVRSLHLEHFPGMTEKSLQKIAEEACARWPLLKVNIIHRVGTLNLGEPIVFVATLSAHRDAAFNACAFIMDYLKTRAPFWKKEQSAQGSAWVEGKDSDQCAAEKWQDSCTKKEKI